MPEKDTRKRIIVYDTDERHVQFKICLKQFGLTQTKVFRQVVTSFLENDEISKSIVRLMDEKSPKKSHRRTKRAQAADEKSQKVQNEIEKKFNLESEELEDIFDMIAREHPDL